MRLELRRKLHPYRSFRELADAFQVTIPSLKSCLKALEDQGELSLESLAESLGGTPPENSEEDLFLAFHQRELCLVCGSALAKVEGRQAGWGEFSQCQFCGFSAHENADYSRLREVALERLKRMRQALEEAQRVFGQREKAGRLLTEDS